MLIGLLGIIIILAIALPNIWHVALSASSIYDEGDLSALRTEMDKQPADAILVLGASVLPDGQPSGILKDRLDTAISLYNQGFAPKIIMSGDDISDSAYDEVTNMKRYAVAQGVPSEDIFCDHAGLCTYDSMYRARTVFSAERLIVVTQRYHLYRALWDARMMHMSAWGVASDRHAYAHQLYYDVREIGARISDTYKFFTHQTSEILSEPVSLSQSGDVTTW